MAETHYLISMNLKKGVNLQFEETKKGNPFCIMEVAGQKKWTDMRMRTANPVWDERLDIVSDFKPKSATLICKDFVNERRHVEIGRAVIPLDSIIHDGSEALSIPISKLDVVGTLETKGELSVHVNFKKIPSNRHHHFSWTHLMHLEVTEIENLPLYARCLERDSELFLKTKMGVQQIFSTVSDDHKQKLDSNGFMFVDTHSMANSLLTFSLMLKRSQEEYLIGEGKIKGDFLFKGGEEIYRSDIALIEKSGESDLKGFKKQIGNLKMKSVLVPRAEVEKRLFNDLFDEYDYDFDGRLNREELFDMFATLLPTKDLEWVSKKIEKLGMHENTHINKKTLLSYLRSAELHETPFINLLAISSLKGRAFPSTSHLLRGFSYPSQPNSRIIRVKNRYGSDEIEEKIPAYLSLAMKSMRKQNDPKLQLLCDSLMPRLTHRQGWHFDTKQSKLEIIPFMALHKIDFESFEKPLSKFKSFNDFFARQLSEEQRPLSKKTNLAVAPSDCRMLVYKQVKECDKLFIKGKGLNIRSLLCNEKMAAAFHDGSVAVCRLAPCDSHAWGPPVDGIQGRIYEVKGEMNAIHPTARSLDMMHRNHRLVTEVHTQSFGTVGIVAVGGPMINSIALHAKPLQQVFRGTKQGSFKFGGSTLVLLFKKYRIGWDSDLLENSRKPIETFVKANDRIGVALRPEVRGKK